MKKTLLIFAILILTNNARAQTGISVLDNFITEWVGKPYKFGGTTKSGIDCSAFVRTLYSNVFCSAIERTSRKQWDQTFRVSKDSLSLGDLVFFKSRYSPSGWHVGVYIGNSSFIHAANRKEGIKISSLNEKYYLDSYKGAGRLAMDKKD